MALRIPIQGAGTGPLTAAAEWPLYHMHQRCSSSPRKHLTCITKYNRAIFIQQASEGPFELLRRNTTGLPTPPASQAPSRPQPKMRPGCAPAPFAEAAVAGSVYTCS